MDIRATLITLGFRSKSMAKKDTFRKSTNWISKSRLKESYGTLGSKRGSEFNKKYGRYYRSPIRSIIQTNDGTFLAKEHENGYWDIYKRGPSGRLRLVKSRQSLEDVLPAFSTEAEWVGTGPGILTIGEKGT